MRITEYRRQIEVKGFELVFMGSKRSNIDSLITTSHMLMGHKETRSGLTVYALRKHSR